MRFYGLLVFSCTVNCLIALPTQGHLVQGEATITSIQELCQLQVQATGKAIIEWNEFAIDLHETVSFTQMHPNSAILNRVIGGSPSQILGKLESNCPLYFINPAGIFIGNSAEIKTAGFLASTGDVCNELFWTDQALHFEQFGDGCIINCGSIVSSYGDVFLIARSIDNRGNIRAPNGKIIFENKEIAIKPRNKGTVYIRLEEEKEEGIFNHGTIQALAIELKTKSPYERAICHTGSIQALTTVEQQGQIYLVAELGGCEIGGDIKADSGSVQIAAKAVHMQQNALIDVSSDYYPGTIRIAEPTQTIQIDSGASLYANSMIKGNGGEITLSAEQELIFHGVAATCAGTEGGDGGTIHLSSRGTIFELDDRLGFIDARATKGKAGRVLFDPKFVTISSSGSDSATGQTFGTDPTGTAVISTQTLQNALQLANVTIQANTDILFADEVTSTAPGNGLTLQAGRSILFNGKLTLTSADFLASINDEGALLADRDAGIATFQAGFYSQIATQGGNLTIDVGRFGGSPQGEVALYGSSLDAAGGNIAITGIARNDQSNTVAGISIDGSTQIQTAAAGTITLNGRGGNGAQSNIGIYLKDSMSRLQTDTGLIHLMGQGGGNGEGSGNIGIFSSACIESTGNGTILLEGWGGNGTEGNIGINLSNSQILTADGSIVVHGTGAGTGRMNAGIRLESNATCIANAAGVITFSGLSGTGVNDNQGVILSDSLLQANTGAVLLTGEGKGSGQGNHGIRFEGIAKCISTGTAPISFQGKAAGSDINMGVSISTSEVAIRSIYGDIQINGQTQSTGLLNQGIRLEMGSIISQGIGMTAGQIHLTGIGSGTDYANGVAVQGVGAEVSSIDGNILLEGTSFGIGVANQPIDIDPPDRVYTTGSGTITYIEH